MGLFHVPGMRKNFGGELSKKPGEIVVLFTISPGRQFEHVLPAAPQLLDITRGCRFRRLIRHLIHLSKKLTLRCLVPDISTAKSFRDHWTEFPATFLQPWRFAAREGSKIGAHHGTKVHQMSK
jgi:hypothetical protein